MSIAMPIPRSRDARNASENAVNLLNSTFVILMSWKDAEAENEGEAFTDSSMDERMCEYHIQSLTRRAGPGAMKIHLKLDFLSEHNLKFEERSSILLARYWDDVKTGVNKNRWTKLWVIANTLSKPICLRSLTIDPRPVALRPTRINQMWKRYMGAIYRREHTHRL